MYCMTKATLIILNLFVHVLFVCNGYQNPVLVEILHFWLIMQDILKPESERHERGTSVTESQL